MKQKIVLHNEHHQRRALEILKSIPLDPVHEILIREHKANRSLDQSALYWKWLTVIGNDLGESKDEMHEKYKDMFLISIYERDNADFAEMIGTLRTIYSQGMKQEAIDLRKKIISLTSTTVATVPQMGEYMDNISRHAASLGIMLPAME